MEFLEAEGCHLKAERGNRVFPVRRQLRQPVQEALERAMYRAGVTVRPGESDGNLHERGTDFPASQQGDRPTEPDR